MENASRPVHNPIENPPSPAPSEPDIHVEEPQKKDAKKKFAFILLGLVSLFGVIALLFSNFFTKSSLTSNTKKPAETEIVANLRVGNVGVYSIFNILAQEKGFFRNNGLNVEITEFSSGPESLAGLIADKTEINIAADFVGVRNIFDHPELRILAQANQHRIFQLAGRKDRIKSPSEIKGKKIGVTENSAGEYFLGNFLAANNLELKDITMVNLTPLDMISQIEEGKIDAMVVFEPHVYNLKKKLGENFVSWDIQGDQNISALVYAKQEFIEKNPDVVKRYLQSLVDAEEYYVANMEETKELIRNKFNYEQDYIEYSWPKLTHRITLNQELLLGMEDEARWTIEHKLTDKTTVPNYLDNIYFDGLSSVKPDSVTIIH